VNLFFNLVCGIKKTPMWCFPWPVDVVILIIITPIYSTLTLFGVMILKNWFCPRVTKLLPSDAPFPCPLSIVCVYSFYCEKEGSAVGNNFGLKGIK
jgi:hypothetical protein